MSRIKRFLTGKTRTGEIVYGIVDALPIFNPLNIARAAIKEKPSADLKEISKIYFRKLDLVRLIVSLSVTYLIVSGKLTIEIAEKLIEILTSFLR